jgi:lysozyme family protein
MRNFDVAFDELIGNEGGYSDNENDPGGKTNWGITEEVARSWGYMGDMKYLDIGTAKHIYEKQYWSENFDNIPLCVSFQVFDMAVNSGRKTAVKLLQKTLGVDADGYFGPKTKQAVFEVPPIELIVLYNASRIEFYTGLEGWRFFGKGWSRRIANNLRTGLRLLENRGTMEVHV